MSKTRQRLVTVFAVIGVISTVLVLLSVVAAMTCSCAAKERVPRRTVLELHLDQTLAADGVDDPLSSLLGAQGTTLQQVIEALERGAHDDRVVGLVAYVDGTGQGMANVEELRDAVIAFRAAGKPAVAFAETFGELGSGTQGYFLATAFDEIYLQPSGTLGLTGLRVEKMYLRGALDKLDVEPQGGRRSEYKSAYEMLAERHMSAADREQQTAILADMEEAVVAAIASRVGGDAARARELVAGGPYLAGRALELGLVDGLVYRDEALAELGARTGGQEAERLYPGPYLERAGGPWDDGKAVVGIVYGTGLISRGSSSYDPIEGRAIMGSDSVTAAFRAAIDDDEVKAIVFRVDSPGGSAVASDAIWRATQQARQAGKPVVVSMGNLAGSGGYYVAAGATKIVAQPSTITGSIGVVAGKGVTRGLWNKLGITWDSVQTAPNAAFYSSMEGYDAEGRRVLDSMLDGIYADFKQRVIDGRGLTAEQVEQLARGRVWTGRRAEELGLVDELGGLTTAIALARREAGIDADARLELRRFPKVRGWVGTLLADGPDNSDQARARARVEAGLEHWRSVAAGLRAAQLRTGEAGPLVVEPLEVR
ncbi:MAG: signal peptide peptidase SppA [Myxococcales bacterium]|nr:signal peptide peptidase SppA [Myxococcales bacterium]